MKPKSRGNARQASSSKQPRSVASVAIIAAAIVVCALAAFYVLAKTDPGEAAAVSGPDSLASTPYASSSGVQFVSRLTDIPSGRPDHVELVYFHRTQRCQSCLNAERLTRATIEAYYSERISSGDLSFSSIDVQTDEGAGVVTDYDAFGPSLYIGIFKGGVHYVFHASDTYVALNSEPTFMSILRGDIDYALGPS